MDTMQQDSEASGLMPREKLTSNPKGDNLSQEELLAIVIGSGAVGCPVLDLSHRLIEAFHSPAEFIRADWLEMKARVAEYNEHNPDRPIKGLADAKLLKIAAAFKFVLRVKSAQNWDFRLYNLRSSSAAYNVFWRIVEDSPEKEHFFVLPMDSDFHAICEPLDISQGSVSRTPVHPRDVFCEAVRYRAYAIIVAHNHPSGDLEPSKEDIEITERLIETGKLLGIHLLDHLVLGSPRSVKKDGFVSIRNLAILKF
jgi:DNA repair protein RadC